MAMAMFADIIEQYGEIGGGPLGLTPMVGEIFLDKFLDERLQLLKSKSFITEISAITNASMVHLYTDDELKTLLSQFDCLTVSVYGLDPEEYRLMTQKDQYQRFIDGLVRVLRLSVPGSVKLSLRQLKARSQAEIDAWMSSVSAMAGLNDAISAFDGTMTFANWSVFDTSRPLPFEGQWRAPRENTAQCALPLVGAQVLVDGTVSFCGCANFDGHSDLNLGNIRDTSLRDLMASERVRTLWNWAETGVPEFCKSCSFHLPLEAISPEAYADPLRAFGG
jgi:MoaA/NifB/PqqE/SkfB family radical SAM enzyme